jgi:hypothetical protein
MLKKETGKNHFFKLNFNSDSKTTRISHILLNTIQMVLPLIKSQWHSLKQNSLKLWNIKRKSLNIYLNIFRFVYKTKMPIRIHSVALLSWHKFHPKSIVCHHINRIAFQNQRIGRFFTTFNCK